MIKPDVLYIGYPKAASTFLRRYFATHPGVSSDEQMMAQILYQRDYSPILQPKPSGKVHISCDESVAESVCVVGSILPWAENLYHPGEFNKVKFDVIFSSFEAAKRLKAIFPGAKVLMVIRDQISWFESVYKYIISSLPITQRNFEDYLYTPQGLALLEAGYYDATILAYYHEFGKENVCVLRYEDLNTELFQRQLCGFVGIEFVPFPPQRVNTGHANLARLHRTLPFISKLPWELKQLLHPLKPFIPGRKGSLLTKEQVLQIREKYAISNTRTKKLLGEE
jgi:hypothetical protein